MPRRVLGIPALHLVREVDVRIIEVLAARDDGDEMPMRMLRSDRPRQFGDRGGVIGLDSVDVELAVGQSNASKTE